MIFNVLIRNYSGKHSSIPMRGLLVRLIIY